jgi:hypothetical protein
MLDFSISRDQRLPGSFLPKRKDPGYEIAVEICVIQLVYARLNFDFHTQDIYNHYNLPFFMQNVKWETFFKDLKL